MSRILVVTNPSHDAITEYFGSWMTKAVEAAKRQPDTVVVELTKEDANREALMKAIEENNPQLVILNGHGDDTEMCGFGMDEILIRCGDNEHCLSGKILHMLACDTGSKLGPACIKVGSAAYIGYTKKFKLVRNRNTQTHEERLNDGFAAKVLDPAFEAINALIEGATVSEAFERSQERHKEVLATLANSNDGNDIAIGSCVRENFLCQIQLGNGAARF